MIGEILSHHLINIEMILWTWEANEKGKPNFTDDGFRAACKIFMAALMDRMWEVQEYDGTEMIDRGKMAEAAGQELRKLIKNFTGLDTHKIYGNDKSEN